MTTAHSPILYIFSGLPGSGKTTLAQKLAAQTGAVYLRIDTIEQALRDLCAVSVQGEGYRLSYRIAQDNLQLGLDVVADSCNPIALTREEWHQVAASCQVRFVDIQVICSDIQEHQQRINTRNSSIAGLQLPTWAEVLQREYHAWPTPPLSIDTAGQSIEASQQALLDALAQAYLISSAK